MYDNIKSDLLEFRQKSAERAEKAEYYRKVLETERAQREQADEQVIELLKDIRSRYDAKLDVQMGRNKKSKSSGAAGSSKGSPSKSSDHNQCSGWGAEPEQDNGQGTSDVWGNNNGNDNDANNGWGNGDCSNNNDDANNGNSGWGNTNNQESNDDADNQITAEGDTNQESGWGNTFTENDSGCKDGNAGDEANNDAQADSGWGDNANDSPKNSNKGKNSPKKKGDSQNALKGDNKRNQEENKKDNKQDKNKKDTSSNSNKKDAGKTNKSPEKGAKGSDKKEDTAETHPARLDKGEHLNERETSSKFWDLRLESRLLQRDKSMLTEQVASLTKARDEAIKKLAIANQEQDTLKVKMRGLTVDLISAKEDIEKLNQIIDDLEAEKKDRERDVHSIETKRRAIQDKYNSYQQQIADLQGQLAELREEKQASDKRVIELSRRNERLEADLQHSKNLIRTLKEGCSMVEDQAKTFEIRHDTVALSKADMERELIAIKEESTRHITTINKLQKSNEQISKAFVQNAEELERCRDELELLQRDLTTRLDNCRIENLRLVEANSQLRKLIEQIQKKRISVL